MNSHYFRFTESDLAQVRLPIHEASGLPNWCYVNPASLELDYERIFATGWVCIGFGKDIPRSGDARPATLLGRPLLMLRDREGSVRVFHNVCSHRGMLLLDRPVSRLRVIRCPYHRWCYDLAGRLNATPNVGGPGTHEHADFDGAERGLKPVRSAVWFDLVFVDLSATAPDFADYIGPLAERWADFRQAQLVHGGESSSDRIEVAANWKFAVENYCEAYHLPTVHPDLNSYSRLQDHFNIEEPGSFSGQGSRVYQPTPCNDDRGFPNAPGLSERWAAGADYVSLYPNLLLGIHRDHFFALRLDPVAVDKTVEELEIYYFDGECTGGDYGDLRRANLKIWRQVFDEDIHVVEGMQRGRGSPAFAGGAFSPVLDGPTHCFHRWVADRLTGPGPQSSSE